MADLDRHHPELLWKLGNTLGRLDLALKEFSHPSARRSLQWNLTETSTTIEQNLNYVSDSPRQRIIEHFLTEFKRWVEPLLPYLRSGVIHNDANDHNVLLGDVSSGREKLVALLDFGDMVYSPFVYEPAVAAAYAMLGKTDPLSAAAQVIAGYHHALPLLQSEVDLLFNLICIRLCTSVTLSASQLTMAPGNEYLAVSQTAAWDLLEQLVSLDPQYVRDRFRRICWPESFDRTTPALSIDAILSARERHIGPSLSISYRQPLKIVRGYRQYLYDESGRPYLDAVNNVPHVGHCHPKVTRAGQRQMALLNTNTRYLHDKLVRYAERLCATMPEPLQVCFFVCSGSEANELALRLARAHNGGRDIIVVDGAYHGNTTSLIEISPYKFNGPGGQGAPGHVQVVPMPDTYYGQFRANDQQAGAKYADQVLDAISKIQAEGRRLAAFMSESLLGCGGQIVLPDNYLRRAYHHVRRAGGVCIADEVQVGFGRIGTHFWGFESQGVVPDIVTLGKPMGNGHPIAAVVTTPEVAASFDNGMEYFNIYGGNPVSCAIGMAVLDVIEEEVLQDNASRVGERLKNALRELQQKHELIGDVRGLGLFLGVELVRDRERRTPAARRAALVVEKMKQRQILLSTDGPRHNVLKIKPPLVFTDSNADFLVQTLDEVLTSLSDEPATSV